MEVAFFLDKKHAFWPAAGGFFGQFYTENTLGNSTAVPRTLQKPLKNPPAAPASSMIFLSNELSMVQCTITQSSTLGVGARTGRRAASQ